MKIKKNQFISLLLVLFSSGCFGQDYQKKFKELFDANDTASLFTLLKDWEIKSPKDPELYVSYFNYYFIKSKSEVISLQKNDPGKGDYVLKDSSGKEAGYLGSEIVYNPHYYSKGLEYIDKGIAMFPKRLDMRFGKVFALGKVEDYKAFTDEIIKTIDYSDKIKCAWLYSNNEPLEEGKKKMLGAIQDYVNQLYNTNDDSLLDNMMKISEAVLKYYPDHVESLTNVSIVYLLKKQPEKALKPLLKAEKLAPKDFIVLNNLGMAYKQQNDKKKAIKYFELEEKYGDDVAKKQAQKQLMELKK